MLFPMPMLSMPRLPPAMMLPPGGCRQRRHFAAFTPLPLPAAMPPPLAYTIIATLMPLLPHSMMIFSPRRRYFRRFR